MQHGMMAEKHVTLTKTYHKRRRLSHGSAQFNYNNTGNRNQAGRDITAAQESTYEGATQFFPLNNWDNLVRSNSFISGRGRPFDRYQNQFLNRKDDNYHRNGSTGTPLRGTWENNGGNPRSLSFPRQDPQPIRRYQPSRSSTPENLVFRRSTSQESGGFVPFEQRFPRTKDPPSSHAVRFTTTEDSINALSDLCPLN